MYTNGVQNIAAVIVPGIFNMIPSDHKASIISAGIQFVRKITEAYGPEKGMELWEEIAVVLDPDVKGEMFFAMITGQYTDRVAIRGLKTGSNKISLIKAFRMLDTRRLGLKEAKDLFDLLESGRDIELHVEPKHRDNCERELASLGAFTY